MEHQLVVDSHPRVSRFGIMPALRQRFTFGLRLVDVASATGLSVGRGATSTPTRAAP